MASLPASMASSRRSFANHCLILVVPERPVADGRASFGGAAGRVRGHRHRDPASVGRAAGSGGAILDRAGEVARTVADPEAAAYEVVQVQRETGVRISEAQSAQAVAERDARAARRRAEQESELRAQADETAEAALHELEQVRVEAVEQIARVTADAAARVAEQ